MSAHETLEQNQGSDPQLFGQEQLVDQDPQISEGVGLSSDVINPQAQEVSDVTLQTQSQNQEPEKQRESFWNRIMTRRGFVEKGAGAVVGAVALATVGCGESASAGNPTPQGRASVAKDGIVDDGGNPEEVKAEGDFKILIEHLQDEKDEIVMSDAFPQRLPIRKGSTLTVKGLYQDDLGDLKSIFTISDPKRVGNDGNAQSFIGIISASIPPEQKASGKISLEDLLSLNGVQYDKVNGIISTSGEPKTKLSMLSADEVTRDKAQAGAFFADVDLDTKKLNVNPVVPNLPETVQKGLIIDQLSNSRVVASDVDKNIKYLATVSVDGKEWLWKAADFRNCLNLHGLKYGLTPDFSDDWKTSGWEAMVKSADIINPRSSSNQLTIDQVGTKQMERFRTITTTNQQQLRFGTVFWNKDDVSKDIAGETNPVKVEAWMRQQLRTILQMKPDAINPVLEAFDANGNTKKGAPWQSAFGDKWMSKAFQFAGEEAIKLGLIPGKDVKFYWNEFRLDQPGVNLDNIYNYIKRMQQEGIHIDGVGMQIYPGVDYYPHVPEKKQLKGVLNKLGELGEVYIEFEVWNQQDNQIVESVAEIVFSSAIEANDEAGRKICTSVGFWEKLSKPENNSGMWKGVFYNSDFTPNDKAQRLVNYLVSV